jgi:hypothetical protein
VLLRVAYQTCPRLQDLLAARESIRSGWQPLRLPAPEQQAHPPQQRQQACQTSRPATGASDAQGPCHGHAAAPEATSQKQSALNNRQRSARDALARARGWRAARDVKAHSHSPQCSKPSVAFGRSSGTAPRSRQVAQNPTKHCSRSHEHSDARACQGAHSDNQAQQRRRSPHPARSRPDQASRNHEHTATAHSHAVSPPKTAASLAHETRFVPISDDATYSSADNPAPQRRDHAVKTRPVRASAQPQSSAHAPRFSRAQRALSAETPPSFRVRTYHLPANCNSIPEHPTRALLSDADLHDLLGASHSISSPPPAAPAPAQTPVAPRPQGLDPLLHPGAASAPPGLAACGTSGHAPSPGGVGMRYSALSDSSASRSPERAAASTRNAPPRDALHAQAARRSAAEGSSAVQSVDLPAVATGVATQAGHDADDIVLTAPGSASPDRAVCQLGASAAGSEGNQCSEHFGASPDCTADEGEADRVDYKLAEHEQKSDHNSASPDARSAASTNSAAESSPAGHFSPSGAEAAARGSVKHSSDTEGGGPVLGAQDHVEKAPWSAGSVVHEAV